MESGYFTLSTNVFLVHKKLGDLKKVYMVLTRVGAEYKSMYLSTSTSTSKMYEYKYEYIFLQCTQVRVLWKVLEYKYKYIFNFIM